MAGAEAEDEFVRRYRGCTGFGGAIDCSRLRGAHFGKALDQEIEVTIGDAHGPL